jgi:carbonic anhydrase
MSRHLNITASEALDQLKSGNQRFASGKPAHRLDVVKRAELLLGQQPKAVIIGCSDSRVPAEIVFDQSLGDLFVIRVAGNIVAPSQIGSVEFAVEQFGTRLVVVLGHSHCGAIRAAIDTIRNPDTQHSRNMRSIVDRIKPAIIGIDLKDQSNSQDKLQSLAVRANISHSVRQLRHGSSILERFVQDAGVEITGAEYSLENGIVTFLNES